MDELLAELEREIMKDKKKKVLPQEITVNVNIERLEEKMNDRYIDMDI